MGDEVTEGNLPQLMRLLGKHTMVRFDPERQKSKFTITVDGIRLTDTDDPTEAFREWMLKEPEREGEGRGKIERQFLWVAGYHDGFRPGSFFEEVINMFFKADRENLAKLTQVYPVHAAVYDDFLNGKLLLKYGNPDIRSEDEGKGK